MRVESVGGGEAGGRGAKQYRESFSEIQGGEEDGEGGNDRRGKKGGKEEGIEFVGKGIGSGRAGKELEKKKKGQRGVGR